MNMPAPVPRWMAPRSTRGAPLQAQLVRCRALQAIHDADPRSRDQLPVVCSRPDGGRHTQWVYGPPTNQLALGEEFK